MKPVIQFVGGHNIALKIPKFKYEETVRFYHDILRLPYLGQEQGSYKFQLVPSTLWLDCMDNYSQQDVWLEVQTDDLEVASNHLNECGVDRRDEVEIHEGAAGYWISDPCGTILRVNPQREGGLNEDDSFHSLCRFSKK
ncbi:hypothetical protein E2L07_14870 [Halalkalibacterium halodurans]|uniref:VOC family protein n=1 Tax=Halalkalibacterium halodurans TaxID=86665 RepID=UPI001067A3EF|nr:hypothetical protein [Halalkalibacterium halodurans]TES51864.1 hypothetical protein E2L07_14870 [Halalkalibacterium halodurans]